MNTTKDGPWIIVPADPDKSVQIRSDVVINDFNEEHESGWVPVNCSGDWIWDERRNDPS